MYLDGHCFLMLTDVAWFYSDVSTQESYMGLRVSLTQDLCSKCELELELPVNLNLFLFF